MEWILFLFLDPSSINTKSIQRGRLRLNSLGYSSTKNLAGQAPVKSTALLFYEEFNWAGSEKEGVTS
jgi:hypothetical protein